MPASSKRGEGRRGADVEFGVGAHQVVHFEECLDRQLPVDRKLRCVPPFGAQFAGAARVKLVHDRAEAFQQRGGAVVEIDESAAAPGLDPAGFQRDPGRIELVLAEDLAPENKAVGPVEIVAPAVERADEARPGAIAAALDQPHAAVTADVVEGPDTVFRANDDNGLFEHAVFGIVADLGNFLQPAGHLPDMRPELLLFEREEARIVIAPGRNQFGIGHPVGHRIQCALDLVRHTNRLASDSRPAHPKSPVARAPDNPHVPHACPAPPPCGSVAARGVSP